MAVPIAPIRPAEVSLDAVERNLPSTGSLPAEVKRSVTLRCAAIIAACAVADSPTAPGPVPAEPERYLSVEEAATILGV